MATFITEESRTFKEYLLLPNLTTRDCVVSSVSLKTPLVKFGKGEAPSLSLEIPFVSAAMQSVSGEKMACALSELGALAFIYCAQTVEAQAAMVANVKRKGAKVGAAVNTHDFKERVPALVAAGVDIMFIDSSDGFSEWQSDVIAFVRQNYGTKVKIGAGNIVSSDAFNYLVEAGADFIKVGVGGGSICITREQKSIGRGQASALIEVVAARDAYLKKTGIYMPICSDGGIEMDSQAIIALAMGADFLMMGRNFARCEESPSKKVTIDGKVFKEYWGEGSFRAQNWQRYQTDKAKKGMAFAEGVDSYVQYAGPVSDWLSTAVYKIKSTMCNCGATNLTAFTAKARLTVISQASRVEGAAHDVVVKE